MRRILSSAVAVMSLAVAGAVFADDAPPTPGEVVGYAESLARSASQGDKDALSTLQTNAAMNDAGAQFGLGEYAVLTKDYAQSIAWFKKAADQDCACGYYGLGTAYESGLGVPRDYARAMAMYLKADVQLPRLGKQIGDLYYQGRGVKQDYPQAVAWYTKAADAGSLEADIALGDAYRAGVGVKQDDTNAMRRYQAAADAGDAEAQYKLGLLYETSRLRRDYKRAALWYQRSSQQGVADAQLHLGLLYSSGQGVPMDPSKALMQFQMAANQGNGQAQYHLADSFATGSGTPADPFRAYQWYTIAGASLDKKDPISSLATQRLKALGEHMSPDQVSRARKVAADWLKSRGEIH